MAAVTTLRVPVAGGLLAVHQLAGDEHSERTVLALHGITANGLSLRSLARALDAADPGDIRVLAPDLAGRGCSNTITGPWGIDRHAGDVIAVLDTIGVHTATLLGHSMGAYVAAFVASRHPERTERLVLVDGGVAFSPPPGADVDTLLTAVIGPAMTRLSMTFPDSKDYLAFMAQNPAIAEVLALGGTAADDLQAYLEHDAVLRDDGTLASSCVLEAIRVDGAAVLTDDDTLAAVRSLRVPTSLLWAPRGLMNQSPGLYTEKMLAAARLPDAVSAHQIPDCNHYSILFAEHALSQVVAAAFSGRPSRRPSPGRSR
jgi:pimeloyl-ACP methyl ester carboxylesterase